MLNLKWWLRVTSVKKTSQPCSSHEQWNFDSLICKTAVEYNMKAVFAISTSHYNKQTNKHTHTPCEISY